jgi:hypothetical protein
MIMAKEILAPGRIFQGKSIYWNDRNNKPLVTSLFAQALPAEIGGSFLQF